MLHGLTDEWYGDGVERYYPILERAREQGKIGAIGLSTQFMVDAPQDGALISLTRNPDLWDVIMLKYGILNQYAAKEILPLAASSTMSGIVNMAAARIRLPDPDLLEQTVAEWKEKGYLSLTACLRRTRSAGSSTTTWSRSSRRATSSPPTIRPYRRCSPARRTSTTLSRMPALLNDRASTLLTPSA